MEIVARAQQGEPLDALVWRTIGQGAAAVERVLEANRGLAALGLALPEGTPVTIPDIATAPPVVDLVQLWD